MKSIDKRWKHGIERFTKITKNEFIAAINFVLSSTYFTFNSKIYKQTFGTSPMGSLLSPIVADLVMQDLKENILNSLNIRLPMYYRYMDDIILSAPEDEIHNILEKFNSYHHRLKFTMEMEVNRRLSFLRYHVKHKK